MEDVSDRLIAGLKRGGVAVESGHRESGSLTDPWAFHLSLQLEVKQSSWKRGGVSVPNPPSYSFPEFF